MGVDVPRVLIADGDAGLRQQLSAALLAANVHADSVTTTVDALTRLDTDEYGVVVIDVALPFGEVDRVIERIAKMSVAQRPVVLVLATNPEAARALDVEIVQIVLRKPVHLSQLTDVVRSCIRSRDHASTPRKPNGDHIRE
jgi:DNA-binding response OmpR family regulator